MKRELYFSVERKQYLLSDVEVSTGGGGVKGDPALIVGLVDAGPMLHQEGHHVYIIIYAGLKKKKKEKKTTGVNIYQEYHLDV